MLLLLVILAALVAWDSYRDQSSLLTAQLKGLVPDAELIARLENGRKALIASALGHEKQLNDRLRAAPMQAVAEIDARIAAIQTEIVEKESKRRSNVQKTLALLTGRGFEEDFENEIDIQLLTAERNVLERMKGQLDLRFASIRSAEEQFKRATDRTLSTWADYRTKRTELARYEEEHSIMTRIPGTDAREHSAALRYELIGRAREYNTAGKEFYAARDRLRIAKAVHRVDVAQVQSASATILGPLEEFIVSKQTALDSAKHQAERIQESVQKLFLKALGILIVVTVVPIGIKAFWYCFIAPLVEARPPIRLQPQAVRNAAGRHGGAGDVREREKVSGVSQEVAVGDGQELLVHPDFLQSSAQQARKDTKWLLDWCYPVTSVAAGMVALTRIRTATPESFVVSSKNDPFAEVGVIALAEGEALVLQPRNLIGLVQPIARPIRIRRRWVFSLSAFITFQFRYLIFEGPGRLLVQGCRGVRLEPAGTGRAIDQNATMGFSANLDYSPKRSETFSAYMMGVNGLFNDSFAGGPGFCVYEEMPYAGKRSGITGRGLEGLTDGLMKVVGI